MSRGVTKGFLNRYVDPMVGGVDIGPGADGTFNRNLIRAGAAIDVSRISKVRTDRRSTRASSPSRKGGKSGRGGRDKFHVGGFGGSFSTEAVIALAVIAGGAYLFLKK